jgi:hypothetical protein
VEGSYGIERVVVRAPRASAPTAAATFDEQLLLAVEAANGGDATTGAEEVAVPPSRGGPTWYSMVFIEYQSFLKKWIYIVYASCVFN